VVRQPAPGDQEIKKTNKSKKTQGQIKKTRKWCDSFSFLILRGENANIVSHFSRFLDLSLCFLAFLGFLDFPVPGGRVATRWLRRRFALPGGLVEKVCLTRRPNREGLPSDDSPIEKVCLPRERERPTPSHPYLIEKKIEKERRREGERPPPSHPYLTDNHNPATPTLTIEGNREVPVGRVVARTSQTGGLLAPPRVPRVRLPEQPKSLLSNYRERRKPNSPPDRHPGPRGPGNQENQEKEENIRKKQENVKM